MGAALGIALGAILLLSPESGHAELGSTIGLGFVLAAVPTLPVSPSAAGATVAARGLSVLGGAVAVVLAAGHPVALGAATVATAVLGAVFSRIGPTAALAVVLIALDIDGQDGTAVFQVLAYASGAAAAMVAWSGWWVCARTAGVRTVAAHERSGPAERPARRAHAVHIGIAVTLAVLIAAALPEDLVGAHWLVTCVILTIQPGAEQTGFRLVQRLSGNTAGALIAAGVLGFPLPVVAVIGVTVAMFVIAMALRPVNYTWWAVTGPPVLLVISEYPQLFPWYEGGVRLAMNVLGASVVLVVVFVVPALLSRTRRAVTTKVG